jgi:hypothetical protein
MNEVANEIASLNWILEVKKKPIEEYVQLAWEEIVDAKYNMASWWI